MRGTCLNAADTRTIFNANPHIAVLSPVDTPRVLDDEELLSVLGSITNRKHTMVSLNAAVGASDHTALVGGECGLICLYRHRDRALGDSIQKGLTIVGSDVVVARGLDNTVALVVTLSVEEASVGVVFLSGNWRGHCVLKCIVHETATARKIAESP